MVDHHISKVEITFSKVSIFSQTREGKRVYPQHPGHKPALRSYIYTLYLNPHREFNHHLSKHVAHLLWVRDNLPK